MRGFEKRVHARRALQLVVVFGEEVVECDGGFV